jgi:hypothetical protein
MKYYRYISNIGLFLLIILLGIGSFIVLAQTNTQFNQTINPGVLSIGIVDANYATVASPAVTFGAVNTSFNCQTTAGALGTASQQLYIQNPGGANNGWVASIAGSAATSLWTGTGATYDFNDDTGSGCTDGADTDARGGQLTINPSVGTLLVGNCLACTTTGITRGSSSAFVQGTTDSITLLTAAASSDDMGDWIFQGISLSQKIPAEQLAVSNYVLPMVVSIIAN